MYRTVSYAIRTSDLLANQAITLREKFSIYKRFKSKPRYDENGSQIDCVVMDITEDTNETTVKEFVASLPEGATFEFYISISTDAWTNGVQVPRYVLDLFQLVGGGMSFSFTSTYSDEDEA